MSNSPTQLPIKELNVDIIHPSPKTYMKKSQGGSKIVVIGKPGCFTAGTPVLMYNGDIKSVEDVQVNDVVMGPDSKQRTVLELCRNEDEMFEICPKFGVPYTVNKKHKLVVQSIRSGQVVEIAVDKFLQESNYWQQEQRIFRVSVDFQPNETATDPYNLGVSLGNGNTLQTNIPKNYKVNDRTTRLQLLAGIIDGGGEFINDSYVFEHSVERLVDDIVFTARSLGFYTEKITDVMYSVRIFGNLNSIPCRLIGKRNLTISSTTSHLQSEFSIVPKGNGAYYGFTLDGDHRFLLGTFDVVRNTGKTTLITSLLYAKKDLIPVGQVTSGTEDSNGHYGKIFPSTFIFNKYNEENLIRFRQRQKIAKKYIDNPWAVLLLDDCTDNPAIFRKPLQHDFYKNGRHWKMLYIVSLQYCMDVMPVIRTTVDGTFILRETNLKNREALYKNYAGVIPDFSLFCDIMDQLTNDYTALYIHNADTTNDWKECVFWYKPKPAPDGFKFGCPDFWNFHYERFNPNYTETII